MKADTLRKEVTTMLTMSKHSHVLYNVKFKRNLDVMISKDEQMTQAVTST